MSTTLSSLRDRVELIVADSANAIWSTSDLDEAIRQALDAYSLARPQTLDTSITLTAAGNEIDISSITTITDVVEVWREYDATDPDDPPQKARFRHWPDLQVVYILGLDEPAQGEVVRIFYTVPHTLSGLDSATATTIPPAHESIVAQGAAAIAALSRALDLNEQVTVDRQTVAQQHQWAEALLEDFKRSLARVAAGALDSAAVPLSPLDRNDTNDGWA